MVSVMAEDLVHVRTRRAFREYCVGAGVLRTIADAFADESIDPVAEDIVSDHPEISGERRTLYARYEASVDWTDPTDVRQALAAFETMLQWAPLGSSDTDNLRRHLARDGYLVDELDHITGKPTVSRPIVSDLPLEQLRDPSAIEEHLVRLETTGDDDPVLTISSAKALVEATCKHVLEELDQDYDDRDKLPRLAKAAQRALKVHQEDVAPTKKGRDAILRTLSNLSHLVVGLAELRNEYGPDHGRTRSTSGIGPRHAHLAVGAAHTYCRFLLETLRDRRTAERLTEPHG